MGNFCFGYAKNLIHSCNSIPNIFPSLRPLLTIISSSQTNDEISAQLVELIGFNEIALVVDILENRSLVKEKVGHDVFQSLKCSWHSHSKLELYLTTSPDAVTGGRELSNNQLRCKCLELFFESKLNYEPSFLVDKHALSNQNARKRMQEQLRSNSARPMFSGVAVCTVQLMKVVEMFTQRSVGGCPGGLSTCIFFKWTISRQYRFLLWIKVYVADWHR